MNKNQVLGCLSAAAIFLTGCSTLRGTAPEARVQEPFDYSTTSALTNNNGGTGFSAAWSVGGFNVSEGKYEVAEGSLSYPNLRTSGNRLRSKAQNSMIGLVRPLDASLFQQNSPSFISFLIRPEGQLNEGNQNGYFGIGITNENMFGDEIFFGKPGGGDMASWVVETRGGEKQVSSHIPVKLNETAFVVIMIEPRAEGKAFSIMVNPKVNGNPYRTITGDVFSGNFGAGNGLMIYSTGAFSLDEIRAGNSYKEVAPRQ